MRVVITGGPCSGKSSIIKALSRGGYNVVPEIARSLFMVLKTFNSRKLEDRSFIQDYIETTHLKNWIENQDAFFDRGLPDEIGYRDFFGEPVPSDLWDNCEKVRYDLVFFLPFWDEIYENDTERNETRAEAQDLHNKLLFAYDKILRYKYIMVPKLPVEERVKFILNHVNENGGLSGII